MVNNIKNNTISEIDAKKDSNTLNEIKNAEIIKYKKCNPGHKELLNLFNGLLDIILTDRTLESESQEDENENENENEDDDDDIIKILTFLNEYAETKNQNEKNIIIKKIKWLFKWNNWQIKIIWRSNKINKKNKKSRWLLLCQRFWW